MIKRYISFFEEAIYYNEPFTKSEVNLKSLYDKYNRLLYKGSLPDIDLNWTTSKSSGGKAVAFGIPNKPETWKVKEIQISTLMQRTYGEFLGVLLHEIIHVYLMSIGKGETVNSGHGPHFKNELRRINNLHLGFEVPETEDVTFQKVSSEIKGKELLVLICFHNGKQRGIQVYNPKAINNVVDTYINFPYRWWEHSKCDYKLYISNDVELMKYPVKQKVAKGVSGVSTYVVPDELIDNIISKGKFIRNITIDDCVNK